MCDKYHFHNMTRNVVNNKHLPHFVDCPFNYDVLWLSNITHVITVNGWNYNDIIHVTTNNPKEVSLVYEAGITHYLYPSDSDESYTIENPMEEVDEKDYDW